MTKKKTAKKKTKKKAKKKAAKKKTSKKKGKHKKAAEKKAVGRPRVIATPEEMDELVDSYINMCKQADPPEPLTLTGMILALGLSSRESFDLYMTYDGFLDSVKRAKLLIENAYERRLHGNVPTGSIFALKNFGWFDKTPEVPEDDEPPEKLQITYSVKPAKEPIQVTNAKSSA